MGMVSPCPGVSQSQRMLCHFHFATRMWWDFVMYIIVHSITVVYLVPVEQGGQLCSSYLYHFDNSFFLLDYILIRPSQK